jgi:hypothetical protein
MNFRPTLQLLPHIQATMFSMTTLTSLTLPWLWLCLGMLFVIFNSGHSLAVFYTFVAKLSAVIQVQNTWHPKEEE